MSAGHWLLLWLVWGAVGLVIELVAVFNHEGGDTLSEQVWRFLQQGKPDSWARSAHRLVFIAIWSALTLHFIFKWL